MRKGFTLIELLIVIAIIGLLATLAIVSLSNAQQKARDAKRVADVKQLQSAVELYFSEEGQYPNQTAWTGTTSLAADLQDYLTQMPLDPSNDDTNYYVYAVNNTFDEYVIGARLEDAANAPEALAGDDDTAYSASAPSGWGGLATGQLTISTGDTPATGTMATGENQVNCSESAVSGAYCLSD